MLYSSLHSSCDNDKEKLFSNVRELLKLVIISFILTKGKLDAIWQRLSSLGLGSKDFLGSKDLRKVLWISEMKLLKNYFIPKQHPYYCSTSHSKAVLPKHVKNVHGNQFCKNEKHKIFCLLHSTFEFCLQPLLHVQYQWWEENDSTTLHVNL